MLKLLRRFLGWDSDLRPGDPAPGSLPKGRPGATRTASAKPRVSRQAPVSSLALAEEDPALSLDKRETGFDPYNTGAFNRSASWEKISKRKDR
jgi:hypothetical protein